MSDVTLYLGDCLDFMRTLPDGSVDAVFTDIPYDGVNRASAGLRILDKGKADIITFDLGKFVRECYRVAKSTIIIFCGISQVSKIFNIFNEYGCGTVRQLVWEKTNPSPMNGQHIYLSSIENAVWYRKPKGTFNASCKSTVFRHPAGKSDLHPTEKNHGLLAEILLDNTEYGDIVFDPCMGSGSLGLVCIKTGRKFIGCEIDPDYFAIAERRIKDAQAHVPLPFGGTQ